MSELVGLAEQHPGTSRYAAWPGRLRSPGPGASLIIAASSKAAGFLADAASCRLVIGCWRCHLGTWPGRFGR